MGAQSAIALGLFDLHQPIAHGGMGEVWRGVHREENLPVAIKVITSDFAREARHRRAFAREVEAIAGLEHPGIVMVLDYGTIGRKAETAAEGQLIAGSPYLVMELAKGGLTPRMKWPWKRLKALLMSILDALAHSHARGVIHRDLKPANVLLFEEDKSVIKLADFGIAWVGGVEDRIAGTPRYMAPEQMSGDWLDFGPWTDLYALACMAWRLATGSYAFAGPNLMRAKRHGLPGLFWPMTDVPGGFEEWLRGLLAPDPNRRFQRAADAAWALEQLNLESGSVAGVSRIGASSLDATTPTIVFDEPTEESPQPDAAPPVRKSAPPPVPSRWARKNVKRSMQLFGAGLALYGLRRPLMVGRTQERDSLWSELVRVVSEGRPRAIVLGGAAGTGKSRLAQWLSERAHEVGLATALKAVHTSGGSPMDGLAPMISRHLRCAGLTRSEVQARIARVLGRWEADEIHALTELVLPRERADKLPGKPLDKWTAEDRIRVVGELLERLAEERPLIVWLDDAQWGLESMELARHMLAASESAPVLMVLTVREDALDVTPAAADQLSALTAAPNVHDMSVEPLETSERAELVRELLGLEEALAVQVEQRTAGVPLFAVQLIGDWVQRGLLKLGANGFQLRDGVQAELPDALHSLWGDRIEHLLEGRDLSERQALELAGVLGPNVESAEWHSACEHLGIEMPEDLVDRMVARDLATRIDGANWAFVHGMLGESVARKSREAGRLEAQRSACSATLHTKGEALRVAGRLREAQERFDRALALATDPGARAVVQSSLGTAQWEQGRMDDARASFEAALTVRRASNTLGNLANLQRQLGRMEEARAHYEEAIAVDRETGNRSGEGMVLGNLAGLHMMQDRLEEARTVYDEALAVHREVGNRRSEGVVLGNLGLLAAKHGDVAGARAYYLESLIVHREVGYRRAEGNVLGNLGELLLNQGDVTGAADALSAALHILREIGAQHAEGVFLGSMALAHARTGDTPAARQCLDDGERLLRRMNDLGELALLLCKRGRVEFDCENISDAQESLTAAETLFGQLGARAGSELMTAIADLRQSLDE